MANIGTPIGEPIVLDELTNASPSASLQGEVNWVGGLRLTGWVSSNEAEAPRVRVCVDGEAIAAARANHWRHIDQPRPLAVRAFDLHLPLRLADGQVWKVSVTLDDGRELPGSPITLVAFDRGLEAVLQNLSQTPGQRLQGRLFDQLIPQSLPFSLYGEWRNQFPDEPPQSIEKAIAVVLLDGDNLQLSLDSLEAQSHSNWTAGVLPSPDRYSFDPSELSIFFAEHSGNAAYFIFSLAGVTFDEHALARIVECFEEHPEAALVYGDLDMRGAEGELWPIALPAFDYERMLEQGYFGGAFALTRAALQLAVAAATPNIFRVANICCDKSGSASAIWHLPGAIAQVGKDFLAGSQKALSAATSEHLAATGVEAVIRSGFGSHWPVCRTIRRIGRRPTVSILIPTRNRTDLLSTCLGSIYGGAARAGAEIIVIDNDSTEPNALDFLAAVEREGVKILRAPGPFNFSRLNNLAAKEAGGDFLCFLNNDVEARDNDWLDEMLSRHVDDKVGGVGVELLWPSGVVQHGGVALGMNFSAAHAFNERIEDDPGYTDLLKVAHSCSAVTAACMTTSRERFLALGGFDELMFPVNFNDVDYCLKLRSLGLQIVFTPHARLIHRESVSRGRDDKADSAPRFARELRALRSKWGRVLAADPYYNPILALDCPPFSALAWPPRRRAPRTNTSFPPLEIPHGM